MADDETVLGREFSAAVVLFHEAVGRALGLSAAERKCLDILDRLGPVSAGRLAEHTALTTGAITGMVDRLQRAGYVDRTPNPDDRRGVLIVLRPHTPRDDLMPGIFGPLGRDLTELAGSFDADQLAAIHRWIAATTGILQRHTAALQHSPIAPHADRPPAPFDR